MRQALAAVVLSTAFLGCTSIDTDANNEYHCLIKQADERYDWGGKAKNYWLGLLLDLTDVGKIGVSAGLGIEADLHLTKFLEGGAGYFGGWRAGLLPRAGGVWKEKSVILGGTVFPFTPWTWRKGSRVADTGCSTLSKWYDDSWDGLSIDIHNQKDRQLLTLGASAHAILIGAYAGIEPWEILDLGVHVAAFPVWVADMLRVPGAETLWCWMDLVNDDPQSQEAGLPRRDL